MRSSVAWEAGGEHHADNWSHNPVLYDWRKFEVTPLEPESSAFGACISTLLGDHQTR